MTANLIGRAGVTAFALALTTSALAIPAPAAAQIPREAPSACKGQPHLKLEPLQIRTARGLQSFKVEVAATDMQREYGLMCRRSLAPDRGMLFVFSEPDIQSFWMRNTLIPLDIVYIGADGRVVSIARNAKPLDETPLQSAGPAQFVLELPGGRAAQIDLMPGDRVLHRALPRG